MAEPAPLHPDWLVRYSGVDGDDAPPESLARASRAARAAHAARRIRKIVEAWPPLTREQLDALAAILHDAPAGDASTNGEG